MNIFFSNYIELLLEELKTSLFFKEKGNPFAKKLVVVPSPAIKSWMMSEMAKDPELSVAFGFHVLYLDQAIEKLLSKRKPPSLLELSLMIELELKKIIESEDSLKDKKDLLSYLKLNSEKKNLFSLKTTRRIFTLAEKLATLFLQYGLYGKKMVGNWETKNIPENLQESLWKTIFFKYKWPYVADELLKPFSIIQEEELEIHLFSFSFLSKAHFDFFTKVSKEVPVHYYFLSPCQAFWSDIQSDKEHYQMKSYLQKKGKNSKLLLDEYFRDQNPLLANFGRLGREMAKLVELSEAETYSTYVVSKDIQNKEPYEAFILDDLLFDESEMSLLKAIQADITLLRDPSLSEKMVLKEEDRSIEVHAAPSIMREIEVLYDLLFEKLATDSSLKLSDIIVMAPNISDYEPYIKKVFGHEKSLLDFHILDLNHSSKNLLVEEFLKWLSLTRARFEKNVLMELFSGSYFQKTHHFTHDELDTLRKWWTATGLKWGLSEDDRIEKLKKEHCRLDNEEESHQEGTLLFCLERLLASLVLETFEEDLLNGSFERLPILAFQQSDAELLGKVTALLDSLIKDLNFLSNTKGLSLSDWATYFECFIKAYFGVDESEGVGQRILSDQELFLLNQFDLLRKAEAKIGATLFPFESIKQHLESSLKQQDISFQESHLNSIRFCSMRPMRAIPSKVIVLIGMNEGAFPRIETQNSLDLRAINETDYAPTKTDFDRYLFLEAFLSARHYFIMTMSGGASSQKKEEIASTVVQELMSYIDEGYLFGEKKFSDFLLIKHPFDPFDKAYFTKNFSFKSYSQFNYKLALQNMQFEKIKKHRFISNFKMQEFSKEIKKIVLDIKDLRSFASNPLKTYFNKTLGIYVKEHVGDPSSDEDFLLDPLTRSKIKKLALKAPLDDVFNLFKKRGTLLSGLFKKITEEKMSLELLSLKTNLKAQGIEAENFIKIDFFEGFREFQEISKGHFQMPSLEVKLKNGSEVQIVGSFQDVLKEGILFHRRQDPVDLIKIWPEYLVFLSLMKNYPVAENLSIFAKCGKTRAPWFNNPITLLEDYLNYYYLSHENISPLIPEWVYDFVYSDEKGINHKIDKSLNDESFPIYNEYLDWLRNKDSNLYCSSFHQEWKEQSKHLYFDLYENWLSS